MSDQAQDFSQFVPSQTQIESYLSAPESRSRAFGRLLATSVLPELYKFYHEEHQRVDSRSESDKFADSAWATIELLALWTSFMATHCRAPAHKTICQAAGMQLTDSALQALSQFYKETSRAK